METVIVTRHAGAIEWLRRKGFEGEVIPHLSDLPKGKRVVGVLPVAIAVQLLQLHNEVYLVEFPARNGPRGAELSADEMQELGAWLMRFGLREDCYCIKTPEARWLTSDTAVACPICGDFYTVQLALEPC
jgi:CRISPR-associated protein Csx16